MYGGIYTPVGVRGRGGHAWTHVSTLLWTPLFCCVSHRGVNTETHSDSCTHKEARQVAIAHYLCLNPYVEGKKLYLSPPVC